MRLIVGILVGAAGVTLAAPAFAGEAFVGRWAVKPAACRGFGKTTATAPLVATDLVVTWTGGPCRIHKMYKLGQTFYMQTRCYDHGTEDVPITFDLHGDRMRVTWNRGKPEDLQRCR